MPRRTIGRLIYHVLLGLGVLMVLALGGIGIFVASFDPNSYKPQIAAAVLAATGRALALNGRLGLKLSLQPTLEADNVAFANPPGASRPQMATLQRLDLQLALLPLLHRQVRIVRMVLVQPDILLETGASGRPNWDFGPGGPASPAPAASGGGASTPIRFDFRTLTIEGGRLAFRDDAAGTTTALTLTRLDANAASGAAPLHLTVSGLFGAVPFNVVADTGSLGRLQDETATSPWPVKLTLAAAGATVAVGGAIAHPATGQGFTLAVNADVPDLAALGALAQLPLPALQTISLQAKLSDTAAGGITVQDLHLALPQADLAGTISVVPGVRPSLHGQLTAKRIDVDALLAKLGGAASGQTGAGPGKTATPAQAGYLIPDDALPFDLLRLGDADITVSIGDMRLGSIAYSAISTHLVAQNGRVTLDPLAVGLPGGQLGGKLVLDAAPTPPQILLSLQAPGLALQPLLAAFGKPGTVSGNLELRAELSGDGTTPHAIAAGLNGTVGLAVAGGQIDSRMLGALLGGLLQKTDLLPLLQRSGMAELRCFAARLDSNKGIGTFKALRLDTSLITMTGDGSVNLRDETIGLHLRPQAGIGGVGIVTAMIVDGSLRNPSIRLDQAGTLTDNAGTAAGLALGVMTGGTSELVMGALARNALSGNNDCGQALALARGTQAAPTGPAAPAKSSLPNPGTLLRQLFH